MKLKFRLWGMHPKWIYKLTHQCPWINMNPSADPSTDEYDFYCITYNRDCSYKSWGKWWRLYKLKKL